MPNKELTVREHNLPEDYLDKPITISAGERLVTITTLSHMVDCYQDKAIILVGNRLIEDEEFKEKMKEFAHETSEDFVFGPYCKYCGVTLTSLSCGLCTVKLLRRILQLENSIRATRAGVEDLAEDVNAAFADVGHFISQKITNLAEKGQW